MILIPDYPRIDKAILVFAQRISIREDQVDDYRQVGAIAAYRALDRYEGKLEGELLLDYVFKSATNAIRSWQRVVIRLERVMPSGSGEDVAGAIISPGPTAEDVLYAKQIMTILRSIADLLKLNSHRLCANDYLDSLGDKEITEVAVAVGVSRATASRALKLFKETVREECKDENAE